MIFNQKAKLGFFIGLALVLFLPLFVFRGIGRFDFWWWLSTNILLLSALAFSIDPKYRLLVRAELTKSILINIGLGILAAAGLYLVFWIGNYLSRQLLSFAGSGINHVYDFRQDASSLRIVLLMLLIIGPGEEIIWRGFIQWQLSGRVKPMIAFLVTVFLYTGIHIGSLNLMLILAALVCGVFWGLLFWRFQSITINVVSHTLWDLLVFIVFPFSG